MPSTNHYIRLQLQHDYLDESNPYHDGLQEHCKVFKLPFISWTKGNKQEAIIWHETGPEIILLITFLLGLGIEIVKLFSLWKEETPRNKNPGHSKFC